MARPRDSQQSKFWNAWKNIDHGDQLKLLEPQEFVNEVVTSRWWKNRSEIRGIKVLYTKRNTYPVPEQYERGPYGWKLVIPQNKTLTKKRLLIYMCHALHPANSAWHGTEFGQVLLEAIGRFCGKKEQDEFRRALRAERFKLSRWSEEAKAKRKEQIKERNARETLARWSARLDENEGQAGA